MVYDRRTMKLAQSSGSHDYVAMVNKPPRPPCWRDFVTQGGPRGRREAGSASFTDISTIANRPPPSTEQLSLVGLGNGNADAAPAHCSAAPRAHAHSCAPASSKRRHRNRLHRTRSEMTIEQCDIPNVARTLTLAETKPREFGLRKSQFDAHVYIEENTRRCERWLEQVRASRPLEDVYFAQGPGIELDIPDEESGVSGHNGDTGSDIDSASVGQSDEASPIPRHSRSRSRHRDRRKAKIQTVGGAGDGSDGRLADKRAAPDDVARREKRHSQQREHAGSGDRISGYDNDQEVEDIVLDPVDDQSMATPSDDDVGDGAPPGERRDETKRRVR